MDELEVIERLVATPELVQAVAESTEPELRLQQSLRAQYPAELVRAAISLVDARRRAAGKFAHADTLWATRQLVEQATPEPVARHKAQRLVEGVAHPGEPIWDLCCGLGADSIALAQAGAAVVSVDQSPLACLLASLNFQTHHVQQEVEVRQANVESLPMAGCLVHIDPDRRAGRRRALKLEDYQPGLEYLQQLTAEARGGAIKLSPASNFGGKFAGCEIELISLQGECKEATVWFGACAGAASARATMLPSGWTLAGDPWQSRPRVGPLEKYVFDPDPAVVRSGLLDVLVENESLQRLDDAEEYLTSDTLVDSPALTAFEILDELPNNDKTLRRYVRDSEMGELEIKARHVPVDVEKLRRKLTLSGSEKAVLIIARLQGKTRALFARRVSLAGE